jgi:acetyl-CoA synthetase
MPMEGIEDLLAETRAFAPPAEFVRRANFSDPRIRERAAEDPSAFWGAFAKELAWISPWKEVVRWDPPHARWFGGGKLNASANCLDRHLPRLESKTAILWEGEPGEVRRLSYHDLWTDVSRFANGLKSIGVRKGDRVVIYMPMVPETAIAMLACARIGAVHSVVFGGFSAQALRDRILDSEARVVITANGGYRRGQVVDLKSAVDEAVRDIAFVERVVVFDRIPGRSATRQPRDIRWEDLVAPEPTSCPPEPMDAEDPLYTLYTSGTTGKPKGIVHTTAGYLVGVYATMKMVFDIKADDVYWCTADVGWVTGHSYIVYGPLSAGATVVMYEGTPDFPDKDRFWDIVERHKVTILYTAPTAIRTFMKWGPDFPKRHDLTSLRLLGSVGEPINPEAWIWYYDTIGAGRCPIVDTWWQTETGMILLTTLPGVDRMKPGFAGKPLPGIGADLVDGDGRTIGGKGGGYLVLTTPWPAMFRTLWKDPNRYVEAYWKRFFPRYFPADGAKRDADGYYMILGRVDDVMNVSGHRIATMEIESALVSHPAVAEAAVVGRSDAMTGQAPCAFVILKGKGEGSDGLEEELRQHVSRVIGPIARPKDVFFVPDLPKTRSGKIMRRLLRDIAEGRAPGDVTTLADPGAVQKIAAQMGDADEAV